VVKKLVGLTEDIPEWQPDPTFRVTLRSMISLTLTIDHRVLDGIQGARFLAEVKEYLEKPFFLLHQFLRGLTAGALKG
jgi:pyruvate dehydrogenase E2 component (dihydrolipoamide acetyltransferase)